MAETLFEEMRRYVRFGEDDARRLATFHPVAAPHFGRIAQEFYDRTREHEEAHAVFTGEEQIARLQRTLAAWMERVFLGKRDEAYFAETSKIGRMHVRIGLPQRYMLTAMALIRTSLLAVAETLPELDRNATRDAVNRALDLELAVMLETYRDDYVERIRYVERLEREASDRAQRLIEDRYRNAVELSRMMIVMIDPHARIRLFNREAEKTTGYARDEVLGRSIFETILADGEAEGAAALERATRGDPKAPDSIDVTIRMRNGKLREIRFQLAHPPGSDDDQSALFLVGRDVSEENKLAARVRQAEKLAAVGTLAAGLAHEIRNPLNGAQLHLTFLERSLRMKRADADELETIGVVSSEIRRLGGLVSEFLDFARPKPLDRRVANLKALCEHAAQLVRPVAEGTNVMLRVELPAGDLAIEMDPEKIEQVLLNVLQNAVEAVAPAAGTTAGAVSLRLRRTPRAAIVEVEDSGPGLTAPDAPIFDPFFSTKPQGTGLGLAIAHRIVTDHDGTIDVESRPGRTVFRIALPIRTADAEEDPKPA